MRSSRGEELLRGGVKRDVGSLGFGDEEGFGRHVRRWELVVLGGEEKKGGRAEQKSRGDRREGRGTRALKRLSPGLVVVAGCSVDKEMQQEGTEFIASI